MWSYASGRRTHKFWRAILLLRCFFSFLYIRGVGGGGGGRVFGKILVSQALVGYEMIIANEVPRLLLSVCQLISNKRQI